MLIFKRNNEDGSNIFKEFKKEYPITSKTAVKFRLDGPDDIVVTLENKKKIKYSRISKTCRIVDVLY